MMLMPSGRDIVAIICAGEVCQGQHCFIYPGAA